MKTMLYMFMASVSSALTCGAMAIFNIVVIPTETQTLSSTDILVSISFFSGLGLIFAMLLIPFLESLSAPLLVFILVGSLVPSSIYFAMSFLPSHGGAPLSLEYRPFLFLSFTGAAAATAAWIVLKKTK